MIALMTVTSEQCTFDNTIVTPSSNRFIQQRLGKQRWIQNFNGQNFWKKNNNDQIIWSTTWS